MTSNMRVARLHGLGEIRIEELPIPDPRGDEVLVKIEACGVCATDARKYAIGVNDGTYPFNPGHEWVGAVVAIGDQVTEAQVGERVYGDVYGGYAEYATISTRRGRLSAGAIKLDQDIPVARAVFLEPLADCLHAIRDQARVGAGDRVVIFGAGSMGLQLTGLAARAQARVLVVEPREDRRELATRFGAELTALPDDWPDISGEWTSGEGFDAAVVALGRSGLVKDVVAAAAPGARVVLFAGFGNAAAATLDLNDIHYREISLLGSEWIGTPPNQRWDCYDEARSILESGELPLEQLVTRQCDLHGIDAVLASFGSDPQPKSILTPGGTQ